MPSAKRQNTNRNLHALTSQQTTAVALIERSREQLGHAESVRTQLIALIATAADELKVVQSEHQQSQLELSTTEEKLRKDRLQLTETQRERAELQDRLTGARARATVLEELERRLDGLSGGAKEVLRLARKEPNGPFGQVRGLVADLLHVDADTAALVETALGPVANSLVIDQMNSTMLEMPETAWAGRTTFLRLDVPLAASAVDRINLSDEPGVVGRADSFVETSPELSTLPRRLLGRYWFVDTLPTAVRLSGGIGRGLNYVTILGEVVHADGTLTVGPRQANSGLLSRRSELRVLVEEIAETELRHAEMEARCTQLNLAIETADAELQQLNGRHQGVANRFNESKIKSTSLSERLEAGNQQRAAAASELAEAEAQAFQAVAETSELEQRLAERRGEQAELETQIMRRAEQGKQLELQVENLQRLLTDHRVALARCEQRRDGLSHQTQQLQHDHQEHDRALVETQDREQESREQCRDLERSVLAFSSELAELYYEKESLTEQLTEQHDFHESRREQRSTLVRRVDNLRETLLVTQSHLQQVELSLQQLDHQRGDLATRMKDDYGIELAVLGVSRDETLAIEDRAAIDAEINSLKHKLQGIGPVNLEALSELEAVEERHTTLSKQYEDLKTAKTRLQHLVSHINAESRQIFTDSLDVIRGHFQELYGSLFGGGEADIVVDDDFDEHGNKPDVLECGIEIVARPPGKQLRSISLLSGGERTMTCVALLLAIFRSRPSPFCVLDEVDAALDEANIDRFVEVLKQFMGNTQFVVVTHSKRTMSCADTLYGVTMQESGVSKRVSVRFDDVSADGSIRRAA